MMFGDNMAVVDSAPLPHSRLAKRHNALAYHKSRVAIAAGVCKHHHMSGATNPADMLSKHWDHASIWTTLKPILFWRGDAGELHGEEDGKASAGKSDTTGSTS